MEEVAQEKVSTAAHMMINFKLMDFKGSLPAPGYHAVWMQLNRYMMLHTGYVEQSRGLFERVFGKGSLKDITAVPAAT
ncbi:hypothetical protein OCU04_006635 [Sclerotinia nivalis]|uniref:Uncharacterized protein n=1 Tax=Sclerotinia nivalis TaxID=352851 RepID=A0A9X0AK57_9HELO|nr:hypothetical protein OCU04_006635 [Sclerotinia nivalis]